jgi:hypothetical protein
MLYNATKRELLEGLIVAELISKRGQGPLARRHFPKGERGPASGVRSIGARAKQRADTPASGSAQAPDALDSSARAPERLGASGAADDTREHAHTTQHVEPPAAGSDAAREDESEEPG